jgi:hypothetical protein
MSDPKELAIAEQVLDLFNQGKVRGITADDFASDKDEAVVVCSPWPSRLPGSMQKTCSCGQKVALSLEAQKSIKARGESPTRIICLHCFRKEYKTQLEKL